MSGIIVSRTRPVGHDIPMTDSVARTAETAEGTAGSAPGTAAEGTPDSGDNAQIMAVPEFPFGEWPSPITAAEVGRGRVRVSFPVVMGGDVWWQEGLPEEDGRVTIVHRGPGGSQTTLLPAPWDARTRAHEYGGLSYLPIPSSARPAAAGGRAPRGHAIVFTDRRDQRLYLAGPEVAEGKQAPRPLTPGPTTAPGKPGEPAAEPALRYADFVASPDGQEIWCVQERHEDSKVSRAIVAIPLDGSAADNPDAVRQLVTGSDFFAFPTPSPDGRRLAWICWNHPHMPWDGTELRVALIEDGVAGQGRLVKGSMRESVLAPAWRDNTSLYVVTDWTGWWNIYQVGLTGEPPQALYPAEEEFAGPLWRLGGRPFAVLGDGQLAVVHGHGGLRLGLLDPETCDLTDLKLPFTEFLPMVSASGTVIAAVGGGPADPLSVIKVDAATSRTEILRQELAEPPEPGYLPAPRPVDIEGKYGRAVHALLYPPANPDAAGPAGELPPFVIWVHGGPAASAVPLLDLEKAFFTSRGIGIIDVNYGGSTGYGRLYRERLRRQWGVVDVEDAVAAAHWLVRAGLANGARLAIRGASAGGWTTLAAVTTAVSASPVFSAATSLFGVADLQGFADRTHDFESRYLDGLIGPLPGFDAVYLERAPVGHVSEATCPVLLLQGLDDPIVLPEQAESIAAELAAHGIRHAHLTFEGEAHGFRKAETIATALEAELSFYGQILGFSPAGIPRLKLASAGPGKHAAPAPPQPGRPRPPLRKTSRAAEAAPR
jgi:dipeptidyl aminopeptidase/acylaminoacyl peptidase